MSTPGAAPAGPPGRPGVAAFDFDGTLVGGDSLLPFLRVVLGGRAPAAFATAAPRMAAAYRHGGRDAAKAALLSRLLAGVPAAPVDTAGAAYGRRLATRVRPAMRTCLEDHRRAGHRLVLVSASLATYLEPFAAEVGIPEVIATRLEVGAGGLLTGRLLGANVRGEEKAARLRALLGDGEVELWAYGNSDGDRAMLAMADHPCLVRRGGPSAGA